MKRAIILGMLLIALLLVSCEVGIEKKTAKAPELIEFLKIDRNSENIYQLQDIFFAEDYNPKFKSDKDIKISYNAVTGELKLQPLNNFSGLRLIHFTNNRKPKILPVIVKEKVALEMRYAPVKPTDNVYVMGSFNTWNRKSLEMKDADGDGIFTRKLYLDEGVYEYQFVTDYGEFPDPNNPNKVDNGYGAYNSLIKVKSEIKANSPNIYFLPQQEKFTYDFVVDTEKDFKIHILLNNQILKSKYYQVDGNRIKLKTDYLAGQPDINTFRLVATTDNYPGNIITFWTKNGNPIKDDDFIWQDAVIYSIMTDRFENGNAKNDDPVDHPKLAYQANFQGGDLQGIINKIRSMYFKKIGVNTIWISPVNETTDRAFQEWPEPHRWYTGYHGYWPTKPRSVEPRLGSMEKLQELIEIAHQHNIKVLLDFVSNHTHMEHPYFQNHRDWYGQLDLPDGRKNIRLFDEYRLTTWFDEFLPSFDFNNDQAVKAITADAAWWMRQSGADGFRHDATKHVPLTVWRNITRDLKTQIEPQRNAECYQIGETFGSAELIKSYVNNGMLDSQFNFELFFTQRRVFADETSDLRDLQMSLDKSLDVYGHNHLMGNIFDSHDQPRMMALLEGDLHLSDDAFERAWQEPKIQVDKQSTYEKQKALLTFILTVPGVPIIYYGDEFGMTGAQDPDNRRMMRFGNELTDAEQAQLEWNSKLINMRTKYSALRRGDYLPLYCDENVMIFSRGDHNQRLIIAINKSQQDQTVTVDLPAWLSSEMEPVLIRDSEYRNGQFELSGYSGNIWKCD